MNILKQYMDKIDPDALRLALKGECSYHEMMQQLRKEREKRQEESEKSAREGGFLCYMGILRAVK